MNELGDAMALTAFASEGTGRLVASTDVATADTEGTSQLLDDTSYDVAATSTAAGVADATEVQLIFTADDVYTFKISDGVRTATVDPTTGVEGGTAGDLDEMLAAINYALDRAGMADSITAAVNGTDNGIVLTQDAGRAINISAFRSDATGSMLVEKANDDTVGVSRFLDDGDGEGAETVSSINIATSTGASAAMEIIDRAIEDVANERAKLGAVSNRLDYTISNLTNVSINTSAAQGRIQDADFAAESTQLAKSQILQQASMAMLAQANASKQGVLSLLQG
jgi:flagellin